MSATFQGHTKGSLKLRISPDSGFLNDSHLLVQSKYLKWNKISWEKEKRVRLREDVSNRRL